MRLVDSDPGILTFAGENIRSNGLVPQCQAINADILARGFPDAATGLAGWADAVLTNPPFADPDRARPSPVDRKARAHVLAGDLDGWIKGALACLRPKGDLVIIHRADALGALLAALDRRFGNLHLRFIHPRHGMPAHRLLLKATVGSRAPLTVLPPLVLHLEGAGFTPEAAAIHRGEARLTWTSKRKGAAPLGAAPLNGSAVQD